MKKETQLRSLTCPNCGGKLEVDDGLDTFHCLYCGYKIILDGQSDAAYRAKTRIKGMEHDERMADKKYKHEKDKVEQNNKNEYKAIMLVFALLAMVIVMLCIFSSIEREKSDRQEKQLQQLVDEIETDINNKNFDEARVKAESIQYTEGWSRDIEKKWDRTRKEVISQIKKAEKEEKKANKEEDSGFFSGLFN